MRLVLMISMILLLSSSGFAQQEEQNLNSATSALQDVLTTLKGSVDQLNIDNTQLAARDKYIQSQVLQLQMKLGALQAQGDVLSKSASKLQSNNASRAGQIDQLEQANFNFDNSIQKSQASINMIEQSTQQAYAEYEKLLKQLKSMQDFTPPQAAPVQDPASQKHLMEKLELMKQISESQQRQEALHQSILEAQKNAPLQPAADALGRQQMLKDQIKDLSAEIASYPTDKASGSFGYDQLDSNQLSQLQSELKTMEHNYIQLKSLMAQMTQKAKSPTLAVSDAVEGKKLQGKIDDLTRESESLRADLDDLRSQMVDLDKRKSSLEEMIHHLK